MSSPSGVSPCKDLKRIEPRGTAFSRTRVSRFPRYSLRPLLAAPSPAFTPRKRRGDRDSGHDFDFNVGVWKTHIRRLQHPLSGSTDAIELDGTVTVRKVWDGRAQLEEIEADGPNGHWEGTTLFLYNPQSHQWSQSIRRQQDAEPWPLLIGAFANGRGELIAQEIWQAGRFSSAACGRISCRMHIISRKTIPPMAEKAGRPYSSPT